MIIRSLLFTFAIALFSQTAHASDFDTEVLFRKGAWQVVLTYDNSDGSFWCSADTQNRSGQSFSIAAYDTNDLALFVLDGRWDLASRKVRFFVDVDYSRWTIDGQAMDMSVSVFMDDSEKAVKFLRELQQGNAVAVFNEQGTRLATFSLNGSYAAIVSLFDCWSKVAKSDPFGPSADPF